jgi:hypothetical protein
VQLNVHVPKDRERLVARLEAAARRLDRPKNQVVLDAIERYLQEADGLGPRTGGEFRMPTFHLGAIGPLRRADIYDEL